MSSSSDKFEDSNSSQRSEQSLQDQEDAVLAKFASVRHEIDSLVDDAESGNFFEGFEELSARQSYLQPPASQAIEGGSQPVSPTLLREKREYRSSHFRSRSTEDLISGHKAVRPSFLSRSFGESFTSEVPVFEGQVSVQWTKTRQSILRGDRSPLGNHQLELPRRRRRNKTKATETPLNIGGWDYSERFRKKCSF